MITDYYQKKSSVSSPPGKMGASPGRDRKAVTGSNSSRLFYYAMLVVLFGLLPGQAWAADFSFGGVNADKATVNVTNLAKDGFFEITFPFYDDNGKDKGLVDGHISLKVGNDSIVMATFKSWETGGKPQNDASWYWIDVVRKDSPYMTATDKDGGPKVIETSSTRLKYNKSGGVSSATLRVWIPQSYLNKKFIACLDLYVDQNEDGNDPRWSKKTFEMSTSYAKPTVSAAVSTTAGKMDLKYSADNVKNGSKHKWSVLNTWTDSEGSATDVVDIDNAPRTATMELQYKVSDYQTVTVKSDELLIPAYSWPNSIKATYDNEGTVNLSFGVPTDGITASNCITGGAFEIQRIVGSQITVIGEMPYTYNQKTYTFNDDIKDLNIDGNVTYRVRRSNTANTWAWDYLRKAELTIKSTLADIKPIGVIVDNETHGYPTSKITWEYVKGIWPANTVLRVISKNNTNSSGEQVIAELTQAQAEEGVYYDKALQACNEMQYKLQIIPGSNKYPTPDSKAVAGSVLVTDIGTISDFEASKGYYADRVELKWKTKGNFDRFRVRRVEYGKKEADAILVGEFSFTGGDYMMVDDSKGAPGVYYTYLVDGFVDCSGSTYSEPLKDVGFRSPTGNIYGRVTYENGQAVPYADVLLESDEPSNGRSMRFNGTDGYLQAGKSNILGNDFTLQAYVLPDGDTPTGTIISKDGEYELGFADGKFSFTAGGKTVTVAYKEQQEPAYTHITAVRSGDALRLYVNAVPGEIVTGSAAVTSGNALYIGRNAGGSYYKGLLDEVRIWNVALDSAVIVRDYTRLLYGGEKGLVSYWRFNDGIDGEFYDLSFEGNTYHSNHGTMNGGVKYDTTIPTQAQLTLKGVTDNEGNYTISGIPYSGQGTMYRIIPRLGTHQFDPTQQQRLIAEGSLSHTCDFTDKSSFPVSGYVYYQNSTVPVKDVMFQVDGVTVVEANGKISTTDSEGKFRINVPVGIHDVRAVKSNHTFMGEGRITNIDGSDRNYQERIENIHLYDSTLVKFIGRVAGGSIQDSYPVGHSQSKNNLGEISRISLKLTAGDSQKVTVTPGDSTVVCPHFRPSDKGEDWKKENRVVYDEVNNQIDIYPNTETGEFVAYLFPENYNITRVYASGKDYEDLLNGQSVNADLRNVFVDQYSIREYETEAMDGDNTIKVAHKDTVAYNYSYKFIKRMTPSMEFVQLTSARMPQSFFGDTISVANAMNGSEIRVPVYNTETNEYIFGNPFFKGGLKYDFRLSAFEEFPYYDRNGEQTDRTDRVPVTDGIVSFNNYLSIESKLDTVSLDSTGVAHYSFTAGTPEVSTNDALKSMTVSLAIDGQEIGWNNGEPLRAVITGSRPEGTRFVTRGPDQLKLILRDPPGSHSYSYFEEGLTVSSSDFYIGSVENEGSEFWTAKTGGKIVTFSGVGAGVIKEVEVPNDNMAGLIHKESVSGSTGVSETQTFTTGYRTSDDVQYVGADGDVFIGNSTNISYGSATCIYLIERKQYNASDHEILKETDDYLLVRAKGLNVGLDYTTMFAYPQAFLENTMIPELQRLRNSCLLPNTVSKEDAQAKANSEGKQVYLSQLASDDPNFGEDNMDVDVFGLQASNVYYKGPSYEIIVPQGGEMENDTVKSYNEQIRNWVSLLEFNEKEKVNATLKQNYSFHGGSNVEYSEEFTHAFTRTQEFNIGIGMKAQMDWGFESDNTGMIFSLEQTGYINNGGSFENTNENRQKIGFVLADEGTTDYLSVDLCTAPISDELKDQLEMKNATPSNFVFKLKGGATSCPFEQGYTTKYYKKGTVIDQRTAQVEVPVINAEKVLMTDVPSSRRAVYKLILSNGSEISSDCVFDLNVIDASNPNGASFYIDGAALGNGRSFLVPAGEELIKTLEVGCGSVLDYPDLQLVFHSQCQYTTLDFRDNIADTLTIAAHFVPSCSDINLSEPKDKWTLNSRSQFVNSDGDYFMRMKIDGYDTNYQNFEAIKLQYKPSAASDADWVTVITYYADPALYEAAQGAKAMIPEGGSFTYDLNMQSLPDQNYDLCAVTVCKNGIETVSNIASGIKDTKRPVLFGSAQPANGILGIEDEIRLNFNETIAEGLLSDNNFEVSGTRNGEILSRAASVRFDGQNDYLATEAERNFTGKSFTVEMGLYIDALEHESTLFSHGNINNSFEISLTAEKKLKVKVGTSVVITDEPIDMKPGEWEHLAVVYTNSNVPNVTAYYNKVQILNKGVNTYTGIGNFEIGRSITSAGNYFCGKISEIRVWDRALSLGTLNKNKDISLKGSEVGLNAYYPMNEGRGAQIMDKARGANALMKDAEWFINRQGFAAQFNGNSYLKLSTGALPIASDMDYTIEFWFKGKPGQTNATLVANGRGDNGEVHGSADKFCIGFNENGLLTLMSNGYTHTLDDNYLDNTWHHYALAVSRNIGRASIIIDGQLKSYFDATSLDKIQAPFMYLGARAWYADANMIEPTIDQYFEGSIDEFRIWEMYKSETLVYNENNINLKGSEMGLFTYYPFEAYQTHQGTKEMVFTTADMTVRDANGAVIPDAENMGVEKTSDTAPVKERGAIIPIQINYAVNRDALIITPYAANGWDDYEESIVTFKVKDVQDVNGNTIQSPVAWSAYIDRNQLNWSESELNVTKKEYEELELTVDIVNHGGTVQRYTIENNPSWLRISPNSGSIDPKSTVRVTFKVDEGLNVGSYNEVIYLMNENGVARALTFNLKVKAEKPNWSVNPADFKYNMSVYGKLRINNIFSADKEDMIAAFVNGQCVGVTNCKYFEEVDMWYAFLTIYGNEVQKEDIEFRIWDDSSGKIYLAESKDRKISFINNSIVGSPDQPVIFDGKEMMYQNIALGRGWNWISFNLATQTLNDVNATLGNGSWTANDEVKSSTATDSYSAKEKSWRGSLSKEGGFNNRSMYMLNSSKDQVLSLSGTVIDVNSNPITVNENWNYIGYLPAGNMTLKEALADYPAVKGDVLKSQTGFAMYSENNGWIGNLTYMEANKGYMLYRTPGNGDATFKYPVTQGSLANVRSNQPSTRAAADAPLAVNATILDAGTYYAENMSVVAVTESDFTLEAGDNVMAYVNGELRGIAHGVSVDEDSAPVLFINIVGDKEAPVAFVVERDEEVIAATGPVFSYSPNAVVGTTEKPFMLSFEKTDKGVSVYPTLFESNLNISVVNPEATTVEIAIYDSAGQMVMKHAKENISHGMFHKDWDGSKLTNGVYLVCVIVNGESVTYKVEKK